MRWRFLFLALAVAACDDASSHLDQCHADTDCPAGTPVCAAGLCIPALDAGGDAAPLDATRDGAPLRDAVVADAAPADAVVADMAAPPPDAGRDAAPRLDGTPPPVDAAGTDAAPPAPHLGQLGEPCPRGFDLDCDAQVAERCVFVGADNTVVPGVEAVCSRSCDDAHACGAGECCYPDPRGAYCLPAGFCVGFRHLGAPCADASECPPDAPLCATDAATGDRFCTRGCADGASCGEGLCCAANDGGRPAGAICKPQAICPMACASDDDCPAVQTCADGACVPRRLVCQADAECPPGEACQDGTCHGQVSRLGERCGDPGTTCADSAPVCYRPDDTQPFCTYNCTFHRDCPATYCCADLAGLNDPAGFFCTNDAALCPPNLPCRGDDDCAVDQFCHAGLCQQRGPRDVPIGGPCTGPGDCAPEAEDCAFVFGGGQVGRGDARFFPQSVVPGICSERCTSSDQCGPGACCRIALQIRASAGVGLCVSGDLCEGGGGGGPGSPVDHCGHAVDCSPAVYDRCIRDRLFGNVCSVPCERGCPGNTVCDVRDDLCHPVNHCEQDSDCADGNRCAGNRCLEGRRDCSADADCEDPVTQRCFEGRCEERSRPCTGDAECDANEVCFNDRCELRDRPCGADTDCRAGETCDQGFCRDHSLAFGEACLDSPFPCNPTTAPMCLQDPGFAPDGVCTHACDYDSDCPGTFCCFDQTGLGDPNFFVCGPPEACEGRRVADRRPCAADADCLAEDFCYRGFCQDRGDASTPAGGECAGPGDCDPGASAQCVVPLEFGYGAGAVSSFPNASGGGACEPACDSDADCGGGCCRHALEGGAPVAFCLPAAECQPVGGPGDPCFPGAHEECDPATTDACVFGPQSETSYCAPACQADADCAGGCCADPDGRGHLYCLQPDDCP